MSTAHRVHSPPSSPSAPTPADKKARLDEPSPAAALPEATASSSVASVTTGAALAAAAPKKQAASKPKGKGKKAPRRLAPDEVLMKDVELLLGVDAVARATTASLDWDPPAGLGRDTELEVIVREVGSGGDALSVYTEGEGDEARTWVVLTPFALPGEKIRVRITRSSRLHSHSALLEVIEPNSELRLKEGEGVGCKYFGTCGGCQFQNISYETQLKWKRETVRKAFANFSNLDPSLIPDILPTIASPKQSGYRTKITPHFKSLPQAVRLPILKAAGIPIPGKHKRAVMPTAKTAVVLEEDEMANANEAGGLEAVGGAEERDEQGETVAVTVDGAPKGPGGGRGEGGRFFPRQDGSGKDWELNIGFDSRTEGRVLDIEECPLATPVINEHYKKERLITAENVALFARDATLLLRDSSDPLSFGPDPTNPTGKDNPLAPHVCITSHKATVHERVGPFHFTFPAGSFFQNNNSILIPLTDYVREAVLNSPTPPTHLVDTYCGSGLFAITLSAHFETITGVEIDPKSIDYARKNAALNGVEDKCKFVAGKSEEIFRDVEAFPAASTAVVIDPPRKGCDEPFLEQLIRFHPATLAYVSCNVHTQARDIGYLLSREVEGGRRYIVESLRGFDLFPQTAHVEGVAILRLVGGEEAAAKAA